MRYDFVMPFVIAGYLLMSAITFAMYWLDKRAAIGHKSRISERALHTLELLGGWPGALLAQPVLRHKSRKWRFRLATWLIATAHVVTWIVLAYLRFTRE